MMQTKLDMFITKKSQHPNNQSKVKRKQGYHDSSRQNSQTQIIEPKKPQNKTIIIQNNRNSLICHYFILQGPQDDVNYPSIYKKLNNLNNNYNPTKKKIFQQFMLSNLKYRNINNIQIFLQIEDVDFWKNTLPKMITFLLQNISKVSCNIRTLVMTQNGQSIVSRQQALVLLISIFFAIIPKYPLNRAQSFGQMMTRRGNQRNPNLKKQKLKFILNYFKIAIKKYDEGDDIYFNEMITFQKSVSDVHSIRKDFDTQNYEGRNGPLINVQFPQGEDVKIEDYYGKAAMVDFANENIGGGVLGHGCVQQQILFLIFPQAIVSMLITPQMKQNESIVMYGLKRYSNYKGYSYNVQFDGQYFDAQQNTNKSVMIAIDAINFSQNSRQNPMIHFNKNNTLRQLVKAIAGFKALNEMHQNQIEQLGICTGRWGCGAFKGDEIWKFFIQWLACSYTERQMYYISQKKQLVDQLKYAVKLITQKSKTVLDLYAIMQHYMEVMKRNLNRPNNFLSFLKSQF